MKKFLILICMFMLSIVFVSCDKNNDDAVNTLSRNINSLKNSIQSSATFDQKQLQIDNSTNYVPNNDYTKNNNQTYRQDYDYSTSNSENLYNQRYLIRRNSSSQNYVQDNNMPSYRTSTATYNPRYITSTSDNQRAINYVENISNLYTICDDTCYANQLLEQNKQNLINNCDEILKSIECIKNKNLTSEQNNIIKEYCTVIGKCIDKINTNCLNTTVNDAKAISELKNDLANNYDKLSAKYLKVLNNIDTNIAVFSQTNATVSYIKDYINQLCSETNIESNITNNDNKTNNYTINNEVNNTTNNKGNNNTNVIDKTNKINGEKINYEYPLKKKFQPEYYSQSTLDNNVKNISPKQNTIDANNHTQQNNMDNATNDNKSNTNKITNKSNDNNANKITTKTIQQSNVPHPNNVKPKSIMNNKNFNNNTNYNEITSSRDLQQAKNVRAMSKIA